MTVRTELLDGILVITLDRQERMNALPPSMAEEIAAAWQRARDDGDVRVTIFTGAGDRAFCSGMDLSTADELEGMTEPPPLGPLENDLWKPVIVAVNGVCAGAGLHFVAEADIAIAASHATFVDPHVTVGQVSAYEPILLSRRIPFGAVARLSLLGRAERIDAETARSLGLVSEVMEGSVLMARAMELAEVLKANSPAAMIGTKKALWMGLEHGLSGALVEGWKLLTNHWDHPDASEGPRAFVEKRPPRWQ
ncbi:MAG: enoyl-CoA hydratase/isomerase family protein [Actinomycetota bacterium]